MKQWRTFIAAMVLLLFTSAWSVHASDVSHISASACLVANDQAGLQRSVYRLTNYGSATVQIFCPIMFPQLQEAGSAATVKFTINDNDSGSNTSCNFSVRRQDGSEIARSSKSTSGMGMQTIEMSISSSVWDAYFDNGNLAASFVLECFLPRNNGSNFTRMHYYSVAKS